MNLAWLDEERDPYVLGLMRLVFSTLLLLLAFKLWTEYRVAYFGDVFHLPLWPEALVPSRSAYVALLALQATSAAAALVGFLPRPALATSALLGLYGLLCDRLHYHNNRYELLLLALLVALTPCDRSLLVWGRPRPDPAPRWAVRLVAAQLSIVYLASSLGKLLDADWRGGSVLLPRFAAANPLLEQLGLRSLMGLLSAPWFARVASLAAIAAELFLALGPWFRRPRALALWVGTLFHLGIELSAHVELFSYTMLGGYLAFVSPERRERTALWHPKSRGAGLLFWFCRRLDVLCRFEHRLEPQQRELLIVRDRLQREHRGLAALRELSRATPLLFPLWLPLWLLSRALRGGEPARS